MNVIPAAGVVAFQGENVLLVKHTKKAGHLTDTYGLPAGHIEVDKNETPKQAAIRELHEETGLITTENDLVEYPNNYFVADIKRNDGTVQKMSWIVYLVQNFSGELHTSEETIPEWKKISEIPSLPLVPNVENAINAALQFINQGK